MQKLIIGIVAVLVLGAIVWLARPSASNPSASPEVQANYDFGTISMAAGKVSTTFPLSNSGTDPITIKKMYTSCMCTTAMLTVDGKTFGPVGMPGHGATPTLDAIIPPGGSGSVEVVFDPNAHGPAGVGKISRVVTLETSTGTPVEFSFSANVIP